MSEFQVYLQQEKADCGPCCLRMITKHYGREYSQKQLAELTGLTEKGVTLLSLSRAAEKIGFNTLSVKISFEQLDDEITLPCIMHWNQEHFVVLPPQDYSRQDPESLIEIADPWHGLIKINKKRFMRSWINKEDNLGIVLVVEPTERFYAL